MALTPGSQLGFYSILDRIGSGGMGEVHRAHDTRLGREVAIKALPDEFSRDPDRVLRFEREARMLAALNHPAVAAIYGLEEADGLKFIVMELVPGETLSEKLSNGALPLEDALGIARQIAEGLEAAHERGIIHRDLKPANIKVTPDGRVKVLDLGLAKAFDTRETGSDPSSSLSPTLVVEGTQPGVILGTAEFMSPEQARGKPVDKRTDIWAFGCILYELLSGRRAFTGETATDVLASIVSNEPAWDALPPDTPQRIRDLLVRCLQKDPNRRLRDIGDARIELEQLLTGSDRELLRFPARRPSKARWLTSAALLLLLAGGAVWLATRSRPAGSFRLPEKKYLVVLPFRNLTKQPNGKLVGEGLVETVSVRLSKIPGILIVTPTASVRGADGETDPYNVARLLRANLILSCALQQDRDQLRITYSLLNAEDRVQLDGDDVTGPASDLFSMQDRLVEKVANSLKLPLLGGDRPGSELVTASEQSRYLQAIGHLQRHERASSVDSAIVLLETLARERPDSALVAAALARAYFHKFDLTHDRAWADQSLAASERARRLDPGRPETMVTYGEALTRTGKPREAVAELEKVVAALPASAEAARTLARAYQEAGDHRRAEESYRRAVALDPGYWAGHNSLGVFYFDQGEYAKAAASFRQVTRVTPDNRRGYDNLGAALQFLGRYDEARAAYEKSVAIEPRYQGYNNLGALEFALGRYAQSVAAYEKAVRLTPNQYLLWANLGDAYRWAPGARHRAKEAYEKAIELALAELQVNPQSARIHGTLSLCYAKLGKRSEARSHLDRALRIDPARLQTLYQAAVVEALAGRQREAIAWLGRASAAGYSIEELKRDPELGSLHDRQDFQEIVRGKKGTSL